MKVAICDDYQDMVHQLPAFRLLDGHEVVRFRAPAADEDDLVRRLRDVDIIVSVRERVEFDRSLLERLPKLKLIALVGRNASTIDFTACTALGIPVSTGKSNSPDSPAELTVALIVSSRRHIALEAHAMRQGDWPSTLSHRLRGSTLGVLGLGSIGSLVAQSCRGMGMNILVWGQEKSKARALALGYAVAGSKAELFERADVLSLHARLRPETRGIVGPDDLARMKPTALIVNTARAELIQPGALVAALELGRPGYAAVDVYEDEPVMHGDHTLLKMRNALCVPHLGWAEWTNFDLYFTETFEQIVAYCNGGPMRLANAGVVARR
ncbi:MAG: D-2-hydroxyacid dehydrogenase family protein [Burkholderiales bacterium]